MFVLITKTVLRKNDSGCNSILSTYYMFVQRKFLSSVAAYGLEAATLAVCVTQQRRCSCSCHFWLYVRYALTFILLAPYLSDVFVNAEQYDFIIINFYYHHHHRHCYCVLRLRV